MATESMYQRILPSPPAIEFASYEGKQLFVEAIQGGTMEGFFKLISYFQTQSEPAYCGLASLSMVLNALAIDPGRKWKGPWRWFDESMLDCCEPLEKVKAEGISFGKLVCLAQCSGANVEAFRSNHTTIDDFRKCVNICTASDDCHLITSYHRGMFKQTGSGHFSPVGGYHPGRDMVLILDVARFKYPPHWVPLSLLWEAMNTVVKASGLSRGFLLISKVRRPLTLFYSLRCRNENWVGASKYLIEDVPRLLALEHANNDVKKLLTTVLSSFPSDFGDFVKLVAMEDVRIGNNSLTQEEIDRITMKEKILKQVQETGLYKHVNDFISMLPNSCGCNDMFPTGSDVLTVLLLALPPLTWNGIRNHHLLQEIKTLTLTANLPSLLQEEVLHLRRQLQLLERCKENKLEEDFGASLL